MRPVKLSLEGFTSFPSLAVVDFRDLDLFAITGPTGAGKTTLLDAMLYALFGQTPRVGANDIRRLVSLGANVVKVSFEFESGPRRYCVTRTAKISTKERTITQIILQEQTAGGEWESIAGGVKEINPRIREILGLDFEGFTRSVILPQGEFDKFLRGEPKQRSEILNDLLNLRVYERMMSSANSRSKELAIAADTKDRYLTENFGDANAGKLDSLREQFAALEESRAMQDAQRSAHEASLQIARQLDESRRSTELSKSELQQARKQLDEAIAGGESAGRLLAECERDLAEIGAALAATGFNEPAWTQLVQAVPHAKQQQRLQAELGARRKERQSQAASLSQLREQVNQAATQLSEAQESLRSAQSTATAATEARARFLKEHGSADLLQSILTELEAASQAMAQLPSKDQAEAVVQQAEQEVDHLQTLHAAHSIRHHLKAGEACPVCAQVVKKIPAAKPLATLEDARTLLRQVRQAHTEWLHANSRLDQALARAAGRDLAALLRQAAMLDSQSDAAIVTLAESQKREAAAGLDAQAARQRLALLEQQLASGDTEIKRAQDALREVAASLQAYPEWAPLPLAELEAALDEQHEARERMQELEQRRTQLLDRREKAQRNRMEDHARQLSLRNRITEKEAQIIDCQTRAIQLARELHSRLPDLAAVKGIDEAAHIQSALRALNAMIDRLNAQLAQTQVHLETTVQRMEQAESLRADITALRGHSQLYHDLGLRLKSDEFVAFIQREALLHLARAASARLSDLSEGRYTLTLSTGSNEFSVIDGWNAGELRNVKTLSGGESFLASLALALALSEGLAALSDERARVRLNSLFIDEGISSLDSESVDIAISAIGTLAAGNRMVGVISHIVELGERLPARIRVEKAQGGSRVVVEPASSATAGSA